MWLLDVDGVVNAFESLGDERFETAMANDFVITWDRTLTDRLHNLHLSGRVEIRWLTTWADDANVFISPLFGWSELTVSGAPDYGREWWKLRYAIAVVEQEHRRLIWTDDDIRHDPAAFAWLRSLPAARVTWLATDPAHGLTHADLDAIEAWLDRDSPPAGETAPDN